MNAEKVFSIQSGDGRLTTDDIVPRSSSIVKTAYETQTFSTPHSFHHHCNVDGRHRSSPRAHACAARHRPNDAAAYGHADRDADPSTSLRAGARLVG